MASRLPTSITWALPGYGEIGADGYLALRYIEYSNAIRSISEGMFNNREMGMTRYIITERDSRREEWEGTIRGAAKHNSKIPFYMLIFIMF